MPTPDSHPTRALRVVGGDDPDATSTVPVRPAVPDVEHRQPAWTGPRFELRGRIGAGNHGVVFRARDHQLERDVAIKRFSHFLADDPRAMRRIQREVAMLARVSHPNVVTVHDLIDLRDGDGEVTPHLVMELVEGTSLRDLLVTYGPSPRSVVAVRGVLEGLAACHRADILHLDIKPANVLVTAGGSVKIVDFGIARAASDATATVAGTPHYMAPEQYDGRADVRSDVYSVGCLLYECLTGHPPFEGSMASQLLAHRTRARPDPRERAPHVSPALAGVVVRAMAIEPSHRFATVEQMLDALSRVDTEPVRRPTTAAPHQPTVHQPAAQQPAPATDRRPQQYAGVPLATRWSRSSRLGLGLGISAAVVAVLPMMVWASTTIPPAPSFAPAAMADPLPWWLFAVGVAVLFLAMRWSTFSERWAGPEVGYPRPSRLMDRGARSALRQAVGGAVRGSLPMLLPWYAMLVAALGAALDLGFPSDPYESSWSLAWLLMPAAALALTWRAVTRVRLRPGRLLMSLLLLVGAGAAGLLFVLYPSLGGY